MIQHSVSPDLFINLLDHKQYLRYAKDVSLLSQEAKAIGKEKALIVIDEIQRCPQLLDEVQIILGELPKTQFILTGSSARKLKRAGINLLGGRAITLHLYPLTCSEIGQGFSLIEALQFGTLPHITLEQQKADKIRLLKSYVETYIKEEVQQEALTRNIPAFAKFLELAAHENGNVINYQGIAREIGVHSKTVKEYFHILEDTLLGFIFPAYTKSHRKKLVLHPKFYFFDCGVVAALRNELAKELAPSTPPYGRAFEHFILLEIKKLIDYYELEAKLSFFRTADGAEVDLIIEFVDKVWAIEIKSSYAPTLAELRGLKSFIRDHKPDRAICVCQTPQPYTRENIDFIPWQEFFKQLISAQPKLSPPA